MEDRYITVKYVREERRFGFLLRPFPKLHERWGTKEWKRRVTKIDGDTITYDKP